MPHEVSSVHIPIFNKKPKMYAKSKNHQEKHFYRTVKKGVIKTFRSFRNLILAFSMFLLIQQLKSSDLYKRIFRSFFITIIRIIKGWIQETYIVKEFQSLDEIEITAQGVMKCCLRFKITGNEVLSPVQDHVCTWDVPCR